MPQDDSRQFAPATQRNREPILAVLRDVLPASGLVLEVASGSGEHAVHFAAAFPDLLFQPSDPDPRGARQHRRLGGEERPAQSAPGHPPRRHRPGLADRPGRRDSLHQHGPHLALGGDRGLVRQAARLLPAGGPLYLYGPYRQGGVPLAPSNAVFDDSLRRRNPKWGLRELEAVAELAGAAGFGEPQVTAMPANNLSVVFRRL